MWVRFTADFDWKPAPSVTIGYLAGMTQNVTRRCAERAFAKNKAVKIDAKIQRPVGRPGKADETPEPISAGG